MNSLSAISALVDPEATAGIVVVIALIQAASVLEQGPTLAALHLAGTPTSHLKGARRLQAMIPITVGAAVCVTLGALAGGLTIIGLHPDVSIVVPSLVRLAVVVVAAAAAAAVGTSLGTPVMRSVLQRPLTER